MVYLKAYHHRFKIIKARESFLIEEFLKLMTILATMIPSIDDKF
jgi:hypothetical protein